MFEQIKLEMIKTAGYLQQANENNDISRSAVNYGALTAYASVMRSIGHTVNVPNWEDDGMLKVSYIEIDGVKYAEN